jgi:hypothetical protein
VPTPSETRPKLVTVTAKKSVVTALPDLDPGSEAAVRRRHCADSDRRTACASGTQRCQADRNSALPAELHRRCSARAWRAARLSSNRPACRSSSSK